MCPNFKKIFNNQSPYPVPSIQHPVSVIFTYFCGMGEISLQDAINQFLQKSRLKSGIQALRIEDVWEEVMGKTVAKYTDKIQIINSTLFITTTVAPLKNELLYQKEKIIERVNEALGEKTIKEVVIK
jgi:hypothetical protein